MRLRPVSLLLFVSLSLVTLGAKCKSNTSPDQPIGNIEFDMLAYVLRSEFSGIGRAMMLPNAPPECLAVSSLDDADTDGVPDDADFVYSATGCSFSIGNGTGTTSGTVHVSDLGNAFGFQSTLTNVATIYTLDGGASVENLAVTGQRQVTGSPTEVTLTQNVQFTLSITTRATATGTETWQAVFTPVQGSEVAFGLGMQLPDGGVVVTGPLTFTQNGTTATLSLSTPTPIRWNSTCGSPFPTSGEVHAQVVSGGPNGYVKVVWSSCGGEAEVDFVEG